MNENKNIIKKDDYFKKAFNIAKTSTCVYHQVGAILVVNNKVVEQASNIEPIGLVKCTCENCLRKKEGYRNGIRAEICRCVHAEQQLIINCAFEGINPTHGDLYCTHSPCLVCARLIANARIANVFYVIERQEQGFKNLFDIVGIHYEKCVYSNGG